MAGQQIQIKAPSGQLVNVKVPEGCGPGSQFKNSDLSRRGLVWYD